MPILARAESLCVYTLAYFLCSHIAMMLALILLKVVYLLILAVRGTHRLLSVSDSFLEHMSLHILIVLLVCFGHYLKVVRWHYSLSLIDHTLILILNALISNIGFPLTGLTDAELE